MGACNFSAQHGAHSAMDIAHWQADLDRSKSIDSDARGFEDFVIERVFETVVLRLHASPGHARGHRRAIENCRKIEASRLPVIDCGLNVQHVNPPHHLVETAESHWWDRTPKISAISSMSSARPMRCAWSLHSR